ncbi:hypothetical protein A2716_00040 [candidate division WWE3 bacterium RIFCSPHIGHO2_01_FULL_40_23]|nr:MAG: hypothetical protein A2716_00040 [candidate division WWE3 bacterium RIFCSPHIGHO2_01_FULL_40_23]
MKILITGGAGFIGTNTTDYPLTNGKQVRDVLYVEDLARAYELAIKKQSKSSVKIYNLGGGVHNAISLL